VFTARYALSPYIKETRFVFKGLINVAIANSHSLCSAITEKLQKRTGLKEELTLRRQLRAVYTVSTIHKGSTSEELHDRLELLNIRPAPHILM
jgi:hypothetical protein